MRGKVLLGGLVLVAACGPDGGAPTGAGATTDAGRPTGPAVFEGFADVAFERGLVFQHESGGRGDLRMPEVMGSGLALFDCDADGDLDIYLVNGNEHPADGATGTSANALFLRAGERYEDASAASGLDDRGYGMGVAVGDLDNDGHVDVYVANLAADRLYRGLGAARFEEVGAERALDVAHWSSSTALLDYDRDGFLDVYVTQYVDYDPAERCFNSAGRPDYCGPLSFAPRSDVLLQNADGRRFFDVSAAAGLTSVACAGLGVVCEDFDDDGWVDVYVANDAYGNQLWTNRRNGTFLDEALLKGAAMNVSGQPEAGMGVVAGDFDADGVLDLFVTHLSEESNTLYRGAGGERGFRDVTGSSGLGPPSMRSTGFGVVAADFDLDADLDLFVANGRVVLALPAAGSTLPPPWNELAEPNHVYRNEGASFRQVGTLGAEVEVSRGLVAGDVDGDGDPDLVLANTQGPVRLYENRVDDGGERHWLRVRCYDPRLKRDAVGARVSVVTALHTQRRTIGGGAGYQSANPLDVWFGLGEAERIERVTVRWPDGRVESFPDVSVDGAVLLERGQGHE